MEILSRSKARSVQTMRPGRKDNREFYDTLRSLRKGEALMLDRKEWKSKTRPGQLIASVLGRDGMRFSCKDTGAHWIIQRIL